MDPQAWFANWPDLLPVLGFSALVGVAIGFALRVALKITLVLAGIVLIALFGLQYYGIIQVNWVAMETHTMGAIDHIYLYGQGMAQYIAGHLPESGAFIVGAAAGMKAG